MSVKAGVAGAVILVQVDVDFGDHVHPPPKRDTFPSLLPGLPEAEVLMYPPEMVIAEKFEAMVRFGEVNTRVKAFHDLWVVTRTFRFNLATVVEAVGGTLRRRETTAPLGMPLGLTTAHPAIVEEHGLWAGFLRRTPPAMAPPPFPRLQAELCRFFGPVVAGLSTLEGARGLWHPDARSWR